MKNRMTKNVNSMQRISLYAPNEPKNDIMATTTPAAISSAAEATFGQINRFGLIIDPLSKDCKPLSLT